MKRTHMLTGLATLSVAIFLTVAFAYADNVYVGGVIYLKDRPMVWIVNPYTSLPSNIDKESFHCFVYPVDDQGNVGPQEEVVPAHVIVLENSIQIVFRPTELPAHSDSTVVTFVADGVTYEADGAGFYWGGHTF